jgi:hypothetical protein
MQCFGKASVSEDPSLDEKKDADATVLGGFGKEEF